MTCCYRKKLVREIVSLRERTAAKRRLHRSYSGDERIARCNDLLRRLRR